MKNKGSICCKLIDRMTKSHPGINFTNILHEACTSIDPKSEKKDWQLDCIFVLLGSAHVKALRKMLVKSTPDADSECCYLLKVDRDD